MAFPVVNYLIMIDEVCPQDGFLLKPLNDLDRVGHSEVSNLNFIVIGPHCVEVLSIGPLTWLNGSG